jgi:hypothetical protein
MNSDQPQVLRVKKRKLLNLSEINGENIEENPLPTEAEGTTGSVDPVLLDVQKANSEEKEQKEEAAEQRAVSFDEESEQTENEEQQVERPKKSEWNGYDPWWWERAEVAKE